MIRTLLPAIAVLLASGCARSHPPVRAPAADRDSEGCIPDPDDRCRSFGEGCPHAVDDGDGCPDVLVELGATCRLSEADGEKIRGVADDVRASPRLTTLRIVSEVAMCGEVVRDAMVRAGVEPGRLRIAVRPPGSEASRRPASSGMVWFEVHAWDGALCNETE